MMLEDVVAGEPPLAPKQIGVVILCGGVSFRSQGKVHPLLSVEDPRTKERRTLLDRKLDRLHRSPLREATPLIVCTPLNEAALQAHLQAYPVARRPRLYAGGLAPRLLPVQHASGPLLFFRDPSGDIAYNPAGHLEALRWLIVGGMLADYVDLQLVVTMSYSNWGRTFTEETLALANRVVRTTRAHPETLLFVEVTRRPREKKTGSMLVTSDERGDDLRLVKYSYGGGRPRLSSGESVLMSTNTLYFSVPNLLRRLQHAGPAVGLPDDRAGLVQLLRDAADHRRRRQLDALFEAALPVEPHLIPVRRDGTVSSLRVERDLDQLTLIPGPSLMKAVEVNPDRGVTIKKPDDLTAPDKQRFLFET